MVFAERAIECIQWIRGGDNESDMPADISSIAAALTSMIHNANFVESASSSSLGPGSLSILLCAKASRPHSENSTKQEVYTLWGPPQSKENPTNPSGQQTRAVPIEQNHAVPIEPTPAMPIEQTHAIPIEPTPAMPTEQNRKPVPSDTNHYTIPAEVSAMCTSLLLDSAGHRTHPLAAKGEDYGDLHCNDLKEVVRLLLQVEKTRRTESEPRVSPSNPRSPAADGHGFHKYGVKGNEIADSVNAREEGEGEGRGILQNREPYMYSSLIPEELQGRTVTVPLVRLHRQACTGSMEDVPGFEVFDHKNVSLDGLRKPDRNSKDQNFALLCIHVYHFKMEGSAGKVLEQFAKKGLTYATSCSIWGKHKKSRTAKKDQGEGAGAACGGFEKCSMKAKPICRFLFKADNEFVEVGRGTVHPRITYLRGGKIAKGYFVVRFASTSLSGSDRGPANTGLKQKVTKAQTEVVTWKRSSVGRVSLIGPLGKPVGTAIMVHDNLSDNLSFPKRSRGWNKRRRVESSMQVSRAVVLCDVRPSADARRDETPYPYAEWYALPSLAHLKDLHFANRIIPATLGDTAQQNVIELLWDGGKVQNT